MANGQVHDLANRLLEDSNFAYAYDANGNLIEKRNKLNGDLTQYTYDPENQLIRVDKLGLIAEYRYDPIGRRIEKVVNGVSTRFVYDNEDIIVEFNAPSPIPAVYIHGPGIDEPLAVIRRFGLGFNRFTYHADGLGSITTLTDPSGTPVRSYTYDSFGRIVDETGTVIDPYTYTGREFDPETGLYYYRTRYYDPQSARFLQEDKLLLSLLLPSIRAANVSVSLAPLVLSLLKGNPQALHSFAYVNNNPINRIDPTGLASTNCAARKAGDFTLCLTGHFVAPSPPGIGLFETILTCSLCVATIGAQAYAAAIVPCGFCGVNLVIHTAAVINCIQETIATPCDECPNAGKT